MNKNFKKYTNILNPGSFSGLHSFKKNNYAPNAKIDLQKVPTYTLHKNVIRKFPRRITKAYGIDHIWQVDLIDLKKLKFENRHYEYLLTCIDVFSRYAFVVPLKKKTALATMEAFKKIFETSKRKPKIVYSDWGNEFKGECLKYLNELGIRHVDTKSIHKAAMVERFNRTLKEKMFRFFTFTKKKSYIDELDNLVKNYNNSYHRIIKTAPAKVNKNNEKQIYNLLYGDIDFGFVDFSFKIGDYVRCIVRKKNF